MDLLKFLASGGGWNPEDFRDNIKPVLLVLFAVVGALAVGYAIFLGILLAKAKDQGERQMAKKRIVSTISSLLIIVVLTIVFDKLSFNIPDFPSTSPPGTVIIPPPPIITPPTDGGLIGSGPGTPPTTPVINPDDITQYNFTSVVEDGFYNFAYPVFFYESDGTIDDMIKQPFDDTSIGMSTNPLRAFMVYSMASGTIITIGRDDPADPNYHPDSDKYGNFYVVRHDEPIHTHDEHLCTVMPDVVECIYDPETYSCHGGPAPPTPPMEEREFGTWVIEDVNPHDEPGPCGGHPWEEKDAEGNVIDHGTDYYDHSCTTYTCYDHQYTMDIGREVYQYVYSLYANLSANWFNPSFKVGRHVETGQWLGVVNIYDVDPSVAFLRWEMTIQEYDFINSGEDAVMEVGEEDNSYTFTRPIWIENLPTEITDMPEGFRVNPLDYYAEEIFPNTLYLDKHWPPLPDDDDDGIIIPGGFRFNDLPDSDNLELLTFGFYDANKSFAYSFPHRV